MPFTLQASHVSAVFFQTDKSPFSALGYTSSVKVSSHQTLKKDDGHQSALMHSFQSMLLTYSTSRCDSSMQQKAWPRATGVLDLIQMEGALLRGVEHD